MIRMTVTALALAASASLALAATDDELKQQIVGSWGQDVQCAQGALTFSADGTFNLVRPGDDTESGTWEITDGILTGTSSDGGAQPASSVTIEEDTLALGAPDGDGRVETFNRCPA
jgi:Lipocalin-like domain